MTKQCLECLKPVEGVRPQATFCSGPCRAAFNNRRANRGSAIYDLFMAQRYQRGPAKALGLYAIMCALGAQYRSEDAKLRHGWRSWMDPEAVLEMKPKLAALAKRSTPQAKG